MSRRVAETALANLAIQGLGAVTGIAIARLLGADGRGELAAAMVWPVMLAGMSIFGADVAFARFAAANPERLRQIFSAMGGTIALTGLLAIALGLLLLPFLLAGKESALPTALMLLAVIPASSASAIGANVALGLGKHFLFNVVRLVYSGAYLPLVLITAAFFQPTISNIALCFLVAAYLAALYGMLALRSAMTTRAGPALGVREVVSAAAPFGLITVMQAAISNLPVALLVTLVSSTEVGYFVVAIVASAAHASVGTAISKILFSKVSRNEGKIGDWFGSIFRECLLLYLALALVLAFSLPYLVPLLFGNEFGYSGQLAIGLVMATSISSLALIVEELLRAKGSARPILIAQIAGTMALLAIAAALVPRMGLPGMIIASILGASIQFAIVLASGSRVAGVAISDLLLVRRADLASLRGRLRSVVGRP